MSNNPTQPSDQESEGIPWESVPEEVRAWMDACHEAFSQHPSSELKARLGNLPSLLEELEQNEPDD